MIACLDADTLALKRETVFVAKLIALGHRHLVPWFERFEAELAKREKRQDALARALAMASEVRS